MRTIEIEINGKKHLLCFNLWALVEVTERYGSLAGIHPALTEGSVAQTTKEALWLLETLMKAGKMYADEMGFDTAAPLSSAQMFSTCGVDFLTGLKANVMNAITKGLETGIKLEEDPKNAETTQAN